MDMETLDKIRSIRSDTRYHRDQKGDDRCWVDDYRIWAHLEDSPAKPTVLPPFEEMMRRCAAFHRFRNAKIADSKAEEATETLSEAPRILQAPSDADLDLTCMTRSELDAELLRLQAAIRAHRDIAGRERTLEDDKRLYRVLNEPIEADFRLPSEADFLGEARAPFAGCPSFWRSHQNCAEDAHDIHIWGPCEASS